ncbi:hypothetical protein PTTG_09429, partial [Puccinia triticina 1-1 BBBD Race 1]
MSQSTSEVSPKTKFLQQPGIYKQDIEPLAADGSNFTKWKRSLNRVLLLTLNIPNLFDNPANYTKVKSQENTSILYLIQITIHDELQSITDRFVTGTEAFDALQTNFQGTVRFRQMELIDKLLEFRVTGPNTDPSQVQGFFNKLFNTFADLKKVGAPISPLVESLILQAVSLVPPSMSRLQMFQNISLQLGSKEGITAEDVQTIITLAYGESIRFDSNSQTN